MPTGYLRSNAMPEGRMIQNNSKRTIATAVLESVITTHFPASRPQIGFVRTRNHFDAIWMPRFAQFEALDGRTHGAAVLRFRLVALWWIDHGNCDLLLAAFGPDCIRAYPFLLSICDGCSITATSCQDDLFDVCGR